MDVAAHEETNLQRERDLARASAYMDAAAMLVMSGKNGAKLTTPAEFEQASLTFSNAAVSIYRRHGLEAPPHD